MIFIVYFAVATLIPVDGSVTEFKIPSFAAISMAFATNTKVSEDGVVTGTYQLGDAIDDVLCLILMIIGLWMLRSGVFEEIREVWDRKWRL